MFREICHASRMRLPEPFTPKDNEACDIVIISRYNPFEGKGGVEHVVHEQIKALLDKGLKIAIVFRKQNKKEKIPRRIKILAVNDRFVFLPDTLKDIIYALPMYYRLISADPQIVIDNLGFTFLARMLLGLRGKKFFLIKVYHGTFKYLDSYSGSKRALAKIYKILILKPLDKLSSKTTNLNIAVSNKIKNELIKYYNISPDRIFVIPNGVDINLFKPRNRIAARRLFRLPLGKRVILFVGGDLDRKGFWTAFKVTRRIKKEIPNVLLLVVTSEKHEKQLNRMMRETAWLKVLTNVPNNVMPYVYNAADVLILPSKYEGAPLTLIEALASGCPAVVSPNTTEKEYEGEGYLVARNFEEYVKYCKKLLTNTKYWMEMSSKARNLVVLRYNAEIQRKLYLKVILKLLEAMKNDGGLSSRNCHRDA